ncbi:MAG: TonB-dependent receptor [Candidatus Acidiferrales bacterium]
MGRILTCSLMILMAIAMMCPSTYAQSATTGFVTGILTDPSGGIIPGAKVALKNATTSSVQTTISGAQGSYRFSFVAPGSYVVSVSRVGFSVASESITVSVGQGAVVSFRLALASSTAIVTVHAAQELVQTQNADVSTDFSQQQVSETPNPGQDLTTVAEAAPGAVVNTHNGAGNFSMYGLPASANMFQLNGMDVSTMYSNLNMSGSTNLTLGLNEIKAVTVVTNAYSGQNGRLAGSQVDYVSRSGSNQWHGNAIYNWNGRTLNANSFFNNRFGVARSFDNVNQWAASLGGPIIKNRTFFFVNQEGIRIVLPTTAPVNIPSPQFQQATLANLQNVSPGSIPFYQQVFSIYNGAPGASSARNLLPNGGCGSFTALGPGVPCALQFEAAPNNLTAEWLISWRIDQIVSASDRFFIRAETEHGTQATFTDPFNPVFNTQSVQPEWQGQFSETHTFGANSVNQFIAAFRYIHAQFGPANVGAALSTLPFRLVLVGQAFNAAGFQSAGLPGRGDTLYQVGDDYSYVHGAHTLRFGVNFRRDLISDLALAGNTAGTALTTLNGFYNGTVDRSFSRAFATSLDEPLALYNLGGYAEDDWRVNRNLNLTLVARFEHNSNPICVRSCFGRLSAPFEDLNHDVNIPYNAAINPNAQQAFFQSTAESFLPRIGFAWTPFGSRNTVVRGGFGVFAQGLPGLLANSFVMNPPGDNTFVVTGPLSPAVSGNASATAAADNAAFTSGFASGATLAQLQAAVPGFRPPTLFTAAPFIHDALYREWNLEVQRVLGRHSAISVNYVGNFGYNEAFLNHGVNAYCPSTACPNGFGDLPASAADARFGTVTELGTNGESNYNGLSVNFKQNFSHGFLVTTSYTYGHALDDVSNGGFLPFDNGTNVAILAAQDPQHPGANYGNADYDVRHSFSATYLWGIPSPFHRSVLRAIFGGWTVAGTFAAHTGFPFTVIDSSQAGFLSRFNNSDGPIFANFLGGSQPGCEVNQSCLIPSQFSPATSGFGRQERNQFRGPGYFDTDLSILKSVRARRISEQAQFSLGAQFFNLLNHPNFDQPVGDISNSQFGSIVRTVSVPASLLGTGLGGDASPRLVQLTAKFTF